MWSHYEFNKHTLQSCENVGLRSCSLFSATDELYSALVEQGDASLHLSAVYGELTGQLGPLADTREL